jgi:hypothetical protein
MREKAMAELQRLRDERMQRRLQREKLRGPSRKRNKERNKGEKGAKGKKAKAGEEPGNEPEGGGLDVEEDVQTQDEGLLGTYEMLAFLEKQDSGHTVYVVMATEFLLSIERQLPALEEVTALPGEFNTLLGYMLNLLEDKHGKELVRSVMMFLASARFGLSQVAFVNLYQPARDQSSLVSTLVSRTWIVFFYRICII